MRQAVSPKVPLSPRQVSCGPVARRQGRTCSCERVVTSCVPSVASKTTMWRTIHVAPTAVRSPRMVGALDLPSHQCQSVPRRQVAPPVVATVATLAAPVTVPTVPTGQTVPSPIVRSVSIPGHVTPTPMAGYPTERWSSSVPNSVSQLASVASAVRASVGSPEAKRRETK